MPTKRAPAAPEKPTPRKAAAAATPAPRGKQQAAAAPAAKGKAAGAKVAPKGAAPAPVRGRKGVSAPPPALPAKIPTVTTRQLADGLADKHQLPRKQAQALLVDLVGMLVEHLKAGDKLKLGGLGMLQIRDRAARTGRNPATGESIQLAASRKIVFRPSKELKASV